jgi:hypothetical protein
MKASEIVTKIKDVLLSTSEKEEENFNDVELKEEAPVAKEDLAQEEITQEAAPANVEEAELQEESEMKHTPEHREYMDPADYATKEEVAELKSMVEKLKGMIEAKEEAREEVPQELSADEAPAEAISHSPENEVTTKVGARFAVNANQNTTYGRVLKALSN